MGDDAGAGNPTDRVRALWARGIAQAATPGHETPAVAVAIALFAAAWCAFHIVSFRGIPLHADLTEIYAWSRHPALGNYKHPPLGTLMAAAWFAVFPAAEWSFRLLALTNAALALFFVDRIARRYLAGEKRLFCILLLMLTPFYQLLAERFASNQTLVSTWPLATWCFLRAFESRRWTWAVAAGATAALAMLGKYWSVYLLAGFLVAALSHPDRRAYLCSVSPWISMAAGALVLAPHIAWLVANDFPPFTYALAVHGRRSFASATTGSLAYLAGAVAYVALPLAVYALAVRPGAALLRETVWPTDPRRRMLVVLLAVPLLLPALLAPFIGGRIVALWTMSAWFLLPVALLSPPGATVTRIALSRTAAGLAGVTVLALVAAPFIAILGARADLSESRPYYAAAARELTALWHATAPGPLPIVMGPEDLVTAITFYSPDHPDSVPGGSLAFSPWVTPARLAAEGWVLVCRGEQAWCGASADGLLRSEPGARRFDRTFTYDYAARGSGSGQIVFVIVPPRSAGNPNAPPRTPR